LRGDRYAAENIPATDHNAQCDAQRSRRSEIGRDALENRLVDGLAARAEQRFAGHLDDHAAVAGRRHRGLAPSLDSGRPPNPIGQRPSWKGLPCRP
jgi:hypothetical protein